MIIDFKWRRKFGHHNNIADFDHFGCFLLENLLVVATTRNFSSKKHPKLSKSAFYPPLVTKGLH